MWFYKEKRESENCIQIIDRQTGQGFDEIVLAGDAMRLIYGNPKLLELASGFLTKKWVSNLYGAYNDSAASKHKIESFVNQLKINVSECEKDLAEYNSFNDFFARKLKSGSRQIDANAQSVICPGDGRLLVFPKITGDTISYVKWAPIKLFDLFNQNDSLTTKYSNGSCFILRLCPSDYHRFHFPVAGKTGITKTIPGILHSVSPIALEKEIPVYALNKRTMCALETENFGKVLIMEIGAMFVGSIVQTYRAGAQAQKGDEKGYFKFGGSTVACFFEPGQVTFSDDLIANSQNSNETFVRLGEAIAKRSSI